MSQFKYFCLAVLASALASALPAAAMADISYYLGTGVGGSRVERNDISLNFQENTTGTQLPDALGVPRTEAPYTNCDPGCRFDLGSVEDPEGTDFAFKVFTGVRFGSYFGAEVGYLNLGEATDGFNLEVPAIFRLVAPPVGSPPGTPPVRGAGVRPVQNRQIDVETKIDGVQAYAVGYLPLAETVELFAKVGLLAWNQDTRIIDRVGSTTPLNQPGIPEILLDTETPDGISFHSIENSDSGTDLAAGAGVLLRASEHVSMRAELEWFDIENTSLTWAGTVSLVFNF